MVNTCGRVLLALVTWLLLHLRCHLSIHLASDRAREIHVVYLSARPALSGFSLVESAQPFTRICFNRTLDSAVRAFSLCSWSCNKKFCSEVPLLSIAAHMFPKVGAAAR